MQVGTRPLVGLSLFPLSLRFWTTSSCLLEERQPECHTQGSCPEMSSEAVLEGPSAGWGFSPAFTSGVLASGLSVEAWVGSPLRALMDQNPSTQGCPPPPSGSTWAEAPSLPVDSRAQVQDPARWPDIPATRMLHM